MTVDVANNQYLIKPKIKSEHLAMWKNFFGSHVDELIEIVFFYARLRQSLLKYLLTHQAIESARQR